MAKDYMITNKRFNLIVIALLLIFLTLMTLFFLKADEVTRDPCSICSEKIGENVRCMTMSSMIPLERVYYPNGTSFQDVFDG